MIFPRKQRLLSKQLITGDDKESTISNREDFSKHSLKKLKKMLEDAVNNEEYEKAVSIRDEISKRQ